VKCVFSIDVEDWFHILDIPGSPEMSAWDRLPSHVSRNFLKLLDLFEAKQVRVTCFFLGWVAERFPDLVREAHRRGHEVASHGYGHRLVSDMTVTEFSRDVKRTKQALEDITGTPVSGYRVPGFSVTGKTPWFFEALIEAGYRYDSSVFPGAHGHGGMVTAEVGPSRIAGKAGTLIEFPITTAAVIGRPICFFGGGYLRLYPYRLIRTMARRVLREGRPVVFYLHPREIDPGHPRLPMGPLRRFKSYVNLAGVEPKVRRILDEFEFATFADLMKDHHLFGDTD
jgi:polysaccharide deacetylase family protein (PEP-CTERM system associated)